jgi:hypothetical protein
LVTEQNGVCLGFGNTLHLLSCSKIEADGAIVGSLPEYQDLFGSNLVKQIQEYWSKDLAKEDVKTKSETLPLYIVVQVIHASLWSAVMIIVLLIWK